MERNALTRCRHRSASQTGCNAAVSPSYPVAPDDTATLSTFSTLPSTSFRRLLAKEVDEGRKRAQEGSNVWRGAGRSAVEG
jgi:hypothetical protein